MSSRFALPKLAAYVRGFEVISDSVSEAEASEAPDTEAVELIDPRRCLVASCCMSGATDAMFGPMEPVEPRRCRKMSAAPAEPGTTIEPRRCEPAPRAAAGETLGASRCAVVMHAALCGRVSELRRLEVVDQLTPPSFLKLE